MICLSLILRHILFCSMKVEELEKEILESRQKIEYYRTKMQELVSTEEFFYVFSFFFKPWGIRGCYTYIRTVMSIVQRVSER